MFELPRLAVPRLARVFQSQGLCAAFPCSHVTRAPRCGISTYRDRAEPPHPFRFILFPRVHPACHPTVCPQPPSAPRRPGVEAGTPSWS